MSETDPNRLAEILQATDKNEAFLREVERRAGASREEMLTLIDGSCEHCKDSHADALLRRILGEEKP